MVSVIGDRCTEHQPFRPSAVVVDQIRMVARQHGWAIGEHGSKVRDIDLIAAVWVEGAVPYEILIKHIIDDVGLIPLGSTTNMPHHRKCQLFVQPGYSWELGPKGKGQFDAAMHRPFVYCE